MPGFFTDYTNNKVLDLLLGNTAFSAPATLYFGLSLAAASKSGSISEPTSGGYARVPVPNNLASFPAAAGGSKSNATAIGFPIPTGSWGTVQSVFIADSPTGGNVIAMADLTASKAIAAGGSAPSLAVGALYLSHT